jgi:hypothetical protein
MIGGRSVEKSSTVDVVVASVGASADGYLLIKV